MTFTRLPKPLDHRAFGGAQVVDSLLRRDSTEAAVRGLIEVFAPQYTKDRPVIFRVERGTGGVMVVEFNIDYSRVNQEYNRLVPPTHSSFSEAYLLSLLQDAQEELHFAATLHAELATDPIRQRASTVIIDADLGRLIGGESEISRLPRIATSSSRSTRSGPLILQRCWKKGRERPLAATSR